MAITGADSGVLAMANSAPTPLTLEYPYPAPCFRYPYVALTARVDVDERDLVRAGQQRGPPGPVHQQP